MRKNGCYKFSDLELLEAIRLNKGANEAFYELYNRYHIKIFNYFHYRLKNRDDANDKHQEVFEKVISSVRAGVKIENFSAYLFSIARNCLINHTLSKYASKTVSEMNLISNHNEGFENDVDAFIEADQLRKLETKELVELIEWAIAQLGDIYKEPLIDKWFNYLSIKEIADKYSITYESAKKRIERANSMIRTTLKPYIDELRQTKAGTNI